MNIQQLRCFTTIAELENMSRAADLLGISQSALSKNIAKLEEEIGTALFDRSGKKIELNAAGADFQRCCSLILGNLDAALEDIRLSAGDLDKRVRIGSAGVPRSLMPCVAAFCRAFPGTELDWNSSIDRMDHIDINEFDALIYPADVRYKKFNGYALGREKYFLAVAAEHPLAKSAVIPLKRLEGLDYVFLRSGREHPEEVYSLCAALTVRFGTLCFADTRELHRQMVASGIAVGFVPEGEAESYRADSRIRLIPIADERFSREMMICFKRDKHLNDRARAFKAFAVDYLKLRMRPEA